MELTKILGLRCLVKLVAGLFAIRMQIYSHLSQLNDQSVYNGSTLPKYDNMYHISSCICIYLGQGFCWGVIGEGGSAT